MPKNASRRTVEMFALPKISHNSTMQIYKRYIKVKVIINIFKEKTRT